MFQTTNHIYIYTVYIIYDVQYLDSRYWNCGVNPLQYDSDPLQYDSDSLDSWEMSELHESWRHMCVTCAMVNT